MAGFSTEGVFEDEAETTAFAHMLASRLSPGDTVLLSGPIGAGKTHLARALIQSRLAKTGRMEDVPSPTFTLVQTYDDGKAEIWHADLYRLTHADEVDELGLADAFDTAICLVEWPDRMGDIAPAGALHIALEQGETENLRRWRAWSDDPRWGSIVP